MELSPKDRLASQRIARNYPPVESSDANTSTLLQGYDLVPRVSKNHLSLKLVPLCALPQSMLSVHRHNQCFIDAASARTVF